MNPLFPEERPGEPLSGVPGLVWRIPGIIEVIAKEDGLVVAVPPSGENGLGAVDRVMDVADDEDAGSCGIHVASVGNLRSLHGSTAKTTLSAG